MLAPWDPDLIEPQKPIVYCVIAQFCSHIADFNPRHSLVIFETSNLHDEWLYTIVIVLDNQAGKDDSMGGHDTESARPKLSGPDRRSMQHELVCLHVQGRSGFKVSDV